jgi:alkylation response protein AidB-like acyl-CoA dehydrogenase
MRSATPKSAAPSAKSIAEFGLIQHKLAEMAVRMYVNESMIYRVAGHIQNSGQPLLKAAGDFAANVP